MAHHWGYLEHNGPRTWCHLAPAAKGLHQSPIDIESDDVKYCSKLEESPLVIHYVPENCKRLFNNGHSVQVALDGEGSCLLGGPFPHKYRLEQFHFHWGKTSEDGAEHHVNGKKYAAELHLVHWNTELYSSFAEASKSSNGLAVLGVFLKAGDDEHHGLARLTSLMAEVRHANDSVDLHDGFDPASLLPEDTDKYWTYCGSLTTPPCYESVRFLIFKKPIEVSEDQLNMFRELRSFKRGESCEAGDHHDGRIVDNYRPVQHLNDRKIFCSFD